MKESCEVKRCHEINVVIACITGISTHCKIQNLKGKGLVDRIWPLHCCTFLCMMIRCMQKALFFYVGLPVGKTTAIFLPPSKCSKCQQAFMLVYDQNSNVRLQTSV